MKKKIFYYSLLLLILLTQTYSDVIMNDSKTTIIELKKIIEKFIEDRNWKQFHSLKNLSMHISVEAAELLELFLWANTEEEIQKILKEKRELIENEVADIAYTLLNFCNSAHIDLAGAIEKKMVLNEKKYPIEKSKGNSKKYTEL
jgi:dCTP diphosphatase